MIPNCYYQEMLSVETRKNFAFLETNPKLQV